MFINISGVRECVYSTRMKRRIRPIPLGKYIYVYPIKTYSITSKILKCAINTHTHTHTPNIHFDFPVTMAYKKLITYY